ncbi:hypothetical protein SAMN05192550_2815 [Flavobacterium glycines]|uniref:Uncharacterized protein n=1 Tax=Flavobacterium glycines TaxID=551990 RepID=A0A1B9DSP9_9FLAO|nr:hypothetical protein [Flavobacterium glycines]OCB72712.1 hypothetical protein FBGL_05150 [Flavobacterium glycines]GEL11810.1 hypothetical protein FGL01_25490 [Flavobacterium glycines]SDJ80914.1 hypothetical protein SAMN05192550_2815 [Flavobacterium glycines]
MVNQNYALYVNEKRQLRSVKVNIEETDTLYNISFSIKEKHLICGLVINGVIVKGQDLENLPFSEFEKYMFDSSNIFFSIPDLEFNQENKDYSFSIGSLGMILNRLIPIGELPYFVAGDIKYPLYFSTDFKNYYDSFNSVTPLFIDCSFNGVSFRLLRLQNFIKTDTLGRYYLSFSDAPTLKALGITIDPFIDYSEQLPKFFKIYTNTASGSILGVESRFLQIPAKKESMGTITNISLYNYVSPSEIYYRDIFYNFIPAIISRMDADKKADGTNWGNQGILICIKRPTDAEFMTSIFYDYDSPESLHNIKVSDYPLIDDADLFPVGTQVKFSDARGIYADSNIFVCT